MKVPFSRVDSGSPEQLASDAAMATAPTTVVNVLFSFIALVLCIIGANEIIRAKTEESSNDREKCKVLPQIIAEEDQQNGFGP
jgi:hypothetical protein